MHLRHIFVLFFSYTIQLTPNQFPKAFFLSGLEQNIQKDSFILWFSTMGMPYIVACHRMSAYRPTTSFFLTKRNFLPISAIKWYRVAQSGISLDLCLEDVQGIPSTKRAVWPSPQDSGKYWTRMGTAVWWSPTRMPACGLLPEGTGG